MTPPDSSSTTHDGWRHARVQPSLPEVYRSIPVPHNASVARKMFAFAGPGYLVAVGYMDPGNWATAIAGGSASPPDAIWHRRAAIIIRRR